MTHTTCPVLKDTQRVVHSGEELLRALRRLRRDLLACQDCPSLDGCPLRAEFNLTIDALVAEINEEWERS
jgi:hypothetical protein